jgi:isopentenyl diphosphate isomerase/L-lactate dehydrogenase-like FMN-dependent dehydrogenase
LVASTSPTARLLGADSVSELQRRARRRLPRVVFDFVDGGAEGEVTLSANRRAFDAVMFRPNVGVPGESRTLATTVVGQPVSMPVLIAPCGGARIVHPAGELGLARAAFASGTGYVFPHVAGHSVSALGPAAGLLWYQLYLMGDRPTVRRALTRARDSGCQALVLTMDGGTRAAIERGSQAGIDRLLSGGSIPTVSHAAGFLTRPRWLAGFLRDGRPRAMANICDADGRPASLGDPVVSRGIGWDDIEWIRDAWDGPIVFKGIVTPDDARRAVALGAAAVVVSNQGGRQLDGAPATLRALPGVVTAVGGRAEVLLDGGVRRGSDVVKALCLGARAVLVGRAAMWGLASGGEDGAARTLEILRDGIDRTLMLLGRQDVAQLDSSCVTLPEGWPVAAAGSCRR